MGQLPSGVVTNNQFGLSLNGTFSGNGAGLTNLTASQVVGNGTLPWQVVSGTNVNALPNTG